MYPVVPGSTPSLACATWQSRCPSMCGNVSVVTVCALQDSRHAQDGARAAVAGQVGSCPWGRHATPYGSVRYDDDQGQPYRSSRRHQVCWWQLGGCPTQTGYMHPGLLNAFLVCRDERGLSRCSMVDVGLSSAPKPIVKSPRASPLQAAQAAPAQLAILPVRLVSSHSPNLHCLGETMFVLWLVQHTALPALLPALLAPGACRMEVARS